MGFLFLDPVQLVAGDAGPRNSDLKTKPKTKGDDPLAPGCSDHVKLRRIKCQRWQARLCDKAVTAGAGGQMETRLLLSLLLSDFCVSDYFLHQQEHRCKYEFILINVIKTNHTSARSCVCG